MSAESPSRPLRILLVENHADTLRWLTLYLEDSGHLVLQARTVAEAAPLLSSSACNVLISDIGLPDGTGWELLANTDRNRDSIFAIAMSGFGMNADCERSLAAGFRHHLLKPFKGVELDRMLCEAAEGLEAADVR